MDILFKKLGGKYSKKVLADLAEGRLSDLPMDILDALRDATGVEDFVRRLVGNQVLGLVGDSASEGLDAVRQTVRKQGNLGLIAQGQSGKMKSGSVSDLDVSAPSFINETTQDSNKVVSRVISYGYDFGKMGKYVEKPNIVTNWTLYAEHSRERMEERGVSQQLFESIVQNGKCLEQANGAKYAFISKEGVVVLANNGKPVTVWTRENFDDKMWEIIRLLEDE